MDPNVSLEDKLQSEARTCPQCGYDISNPMTDRCPRCFSKVDRVETNCGSCTHQGNCEFARVYEQAHKKKDN